jgi:hypothetical protein
MTKQFVTLKERASKMGNQEARKMKELKQELEVLKMENAGLRLCLTKPLYKFTSKPEDVTVDASRLTW